ncbi:nitroreductase family protein [Anaerosphaera multitolerans]|uniref:Nitroreductase family protein n=1 Tax=Anaerosphaera multitolerans TaxID=2487351 RepID=A0A437S6X1_9FIRM|nr:nitroreductase family protein [Anaerosphaera multitolerans]RVU54698.1 nitroreductase family protein [Anaerosphaera multitolerans]
MELKTVELLKNRRSFYVLDKNIKVSEEEIKEAIREIVKYSPSPFNVQSEKVVVLFGEDHDYLWGTIVMETLRKIVGGEEKFKETEAKINGFKNGYGTILIFEDKDILEEAKKGLGSYAPNLDTWSEHANGIVTIGLWIGLRELGLGANLQHYNPIIDEEVKDKWDIPKNWILKSQMVFGNILEHPEEKSKIDINSRVVFK